MLLAMMMMIYNPVPACGHCWGREPPAQLPGLSHPAYSFRVGPRMAWVRSRLAWVEMKTCLNEAKNGLRRMILA